MSKFRFQDLDVRKASIEISDGLLDCADTLEGQRLYRFAEQLRGATMSMSNNIAEGSGSSSAKEFSYFLNIARRSAFETANILILLARRGIISDEQSDGFLAELDSLCRRITSFQRSLRPRF